MGIKDLTAFLREHAPNSISKGNLSQFTSQFPKSRRLRAAIDTSLFMYKYKYKSGDNFIVDFLEQINRLLINNIEPIYIFDGAPPSEKSDTLKSRKERKINLSILGVGVGYSTRTLSTSTILILSRRG